MSGIEHLLDRQVLFLGGKGGVGKTTLAAMLALEASARGNRTLLVSTDPAHSTSDILETDLGPDPRMVAADCWGMEIDPQQAVDDYIEGVKALASRTAAPRLLAEVERQIDVSRVSPGAEEAALFDRFAVVLETRMEDFDRIVFDTAPTALTLRLLSLPELMSSWISGLIVRRKKVNVLGRMWRNVAGAAAGEVAEMEDPVLAVLEERRARFDRVRRILTDQTRAAFVFVVVPERLPIRETVRSAAILVKHGIPIGGVLVNRVLPAVPVETVPARRREREAEHRAIIEQELGEWPLAWIPLQESDVVGIPALRQLAADALPQPPIRGAM